MGFLLLFINECKILHYSNISVPFCLNIVAPQITPFEFGEEPINSGDMASVFCSVNKGDIPLNITWTLNNQSVAIIGISVLRTNKRISQLSIDDVRADHAGEYTCLASNLAGTTKHSAYLNINGNFL